MYVLGGSDESAQRVSLTTNVPVLSLDTLTWELISIAAPPAPAPAPAPVPAQSTVAKPTPATAAAAVDTKSAPTATAGSGSGGGGGGGPAGREMFAAVAIGSVIYMYGGRATDRYLDDVWCVDTARTPMQWVSIGTTAGSGNGGSGGAISLCGHTPFVFAAPTATTTTAAATPSDSKSATVQPQQQRLVIGSFGGIDPANRMHDAWYFDFDTSSAASLASSGLNGRWSILPPRPPPATAPSASSSPPPAARFAHSLTALPDGRSVLFGGLNATGDFNDLCVLSVVVNPAPTPPANASAAAKK